MYDVVKQAIEECKEWYRKAKLYVQITYLTRLGYI
jgi:hypothetical protein